MRKIGGIIGCCLIAVSLLACTACSGLERLSENLREGAEQLGDDVVIGKSNALIAPISLLRAAGLRTTMLFWPPMTLL